MRNRRIGSPSYNSNFCTGSDESSQFISGIIRKNGQNRPYVYYSGTRTVITFVEHTKWISCLMFYLCLPSKCQPREISHRVPGSKIISRTSVVSIVAQRNYTGISTLETEHTLRGGLADLTPKSSTT